MAALLLTSCDSGQISHFVLDSSESGDVMKIDSLPNLIIYYPHFKKMDLVFEDMPEKGENGVTMCVGAAYTGELKKKFSHSNIGGNHVGNGRFHSGYPCKANTGAFVWYGGKWKFLLGEYADEVTKAADNHGMAFGQTMIIHQGMRQPCHLRGRTFFRALCEKDGKLCIIESRRQQDFEYFVKCLGAIKVKHAISLVMGKGWNYSWFEDNSGVIHDMHPIKGKYATNWIAFYR